MGWQGLTCCHNSDRYYLFSSAGSFEVLLTGRIAEITVSLTRAPELRPGERLVVRRHWHCSLPLPNTGPTSPNSIWARRTHGDFSQQGDVWTNDRAGRGGLWIPERSAVTRSHPWDCHLFPSAPWLATSRVSKPDWNSENTRKRQRSLELGWGAIWQGACFLCRPHTLWDWMGLGWWCNVFMELTH